jgi:hypothetical protein
VPRKFRLHQILGVVFIVLGLAAAVVGLLTATVLRDSDAVVGVATAGESNAATTDPGVLQLVGKSVTVTADVAEGDVALVVGRTEDVLGWLGTDAYTRVTGLSTWTALATTEVAATGEAPAPVPDPATSDMWTQSATQTGSASLTWTDEPGSWSVLAVSTSAAPPVLTLSWERDVSTPLMFPLLAAGGLLLAAGAGALILGRKGLLPSKDEVLSAPGAVATKVTSALKDRIPSESELDDGETPGEETTSRWNSPFDASPATGTTETVEPPTTTSPFSIQGQHPFAPTTSAIPVVADSAASVFDDEDGDAVGDQNAAAGVGQEATTGVVPITDAPVEPTDTTPDNATGFGAAQSEPTYSTDAPTGAIPATQPTYTGTPIPVDEPAPVTSGMSRREIREAEARAKEEAKKAKRSRTVKALTGMIPIVGKSDPEPPPAPEPEPESDRGDAFRQAWGIPTESTERGEQ